ncbi:MAG: D-alanyl-D-alanine carboxypeptidase [Okeania sp. SIO3B5]|uniref:D-alanyl-D-alanine carboxypeptidase n=1 Tax=Okeania sp. SIO3B5 TaxID=2607811 RepID=UPI0014016158|nr:D-alanyl-D-alanine carboxypeptidase [Okeania sp. SIO3B5]NEO55871.1 D-alanyl-D-alanine carboxypeptidase [Okeania sp. SIO3B5]
MWDLFSYGIISLWLEMAGIQTIGQNTVTILKWQTGLPQLISPENSEQILTIEVDEYLKGLAAKRLLTSDAQGIWIQSEFKLLHGREGTVPMPGASLTKIATSLAALETWGPQHQFETLVSTTGPITNGILRGDLVINGGNDPYFVWEEAIALGNAIQKLGINQVTGNLIVVGDFWMNYQTDPIIAGQLLREGINSATWSNNVRNIYNRMPPGTLQPKVAIAGSVIYQKSISTEIPIIRHKSLPLIYILKTMNVESNNKLAEIIASNLGGAKIVQQKAAWTAGVPQAEIQLINGSGLGVENKISPRAVSGMLIAIQRYLQTSEWVIADLFPVSGYDRGTLVDQSRNIPQGSAVKTGTLNDVIALAGVIPTREEGLVWFTMINRSPYWEATRVEQDKFLQQLVSLWGVTEVPKIISPKIHGNKLGLGASDRNQILGKYN